MGGLGSRGDDRLGLGPLGWIQSVFNFIRNCQRAALPNGDGGFGGSAHGSCGQVGILAVPVRLPFHLILLCICSATSDLEPLFRPRLPSAYLLRPRSDLLFIFKWGVWVSLRLERPLCVLGVRRVHSGHPEVKDIFVRRGNVRL